MSAGWEDNAEEEQKKKGREGKMKKIEDQGVGEEKGRKKR
jgi:hypothetical protein